MTEKTTPPSVRITPTIKIQFNRNEALQPCPFCGEMPNLLNVPDPRYGEFARSWIVECKQMGCIFSRSSPNQSFEALLKQWNTRYECGGEGTVYELTTPGESSGDYLEVG